MGRGKKSATARARHALAGSTQGYTSRKALLADAKDVYRRVHPTDEAYELGLNEIAGTGVLTVPKLGIVLPRKTRLQHKTAGPSVLYEARRNEKGDVQLSVTPLDKTRLGTKFKRPWLSVESFVRVLPGQADTRPQSKKIREQKERKSDLQGFNHYLTKHAEELVLNRLIEAFGLAQEPVVLDNRAELDRRLAGDSPDLLSNCLRKLEVIEEAVAGVDIVSLLEPSFRGRRLVEARDVSGNVLGTDAGDLLCLFDDGTSLAVSIKTYSMGRAALAGGQTGIRQAVDRVYGWDEARLEEACKRRMDDEVAVVRKDPERAATLLRWVMVEHLGLEEPDEDGGWREPADPSDLSRCRVSDLAGANELVFNLGAGLMGDDEAEVLTINGKTGAVLLGGSLLLRLPQLTAEDLPRFSFKGANRYPVIDFDGKYLYEHQLHKGRGVMTRAVVDEA